MLRFSVLLLAGCLLAGQSQANDTLHHRKSAAIMPDADNAGL